jgi:hypothetical protein
MFRSKFPVSPMTTSFFLDAILSTRGKKDYNDSDISFKLSHYGFKIQMSMYYQWPKSPMRLKKEEKT